MSKINFDKKLLKHIATLARIDLTPAEVDTYQDQISRVIEHIDRLSKVDTTNIKPTFQVTDTKNIFNASLTCHLPVKSAISTARSTHKNFIVVPASLKK